MLNATALVCDKSTRFINPSEPGKAFLPIDGRMLMETIICELDRIFDQVWVAAGENNAFGYSKNCIPLIEEQVSKINLKVIDFFYKVKLNNPVYVNDCWIFPVLMKPE